ncbi:glycoside hydrolase family 43 protein [Actinacidiphila acididurans]|uniref:Glycoside hydrolase family 43 protein n=1 Tax=Actinacidiphila acididurans TaxID=2784346 RepID=A0ABS2TIT4_9ACTN|nr:glycoside hydrolase family 43 protein [Actinacidiphila acididurans]MBM9503252.1 glycoside hydrolase family 43 protein [Actinacidiphila acididurans]
MRMYDNPVLGGFHPDPSVCRVGEDYYLVCSSFEYFPGVPLFHSRDLVHWRQIGNVLDRPAQLTLPDDVPASGGVYAPTIRHHDGRFYVITTNVSGGGNFVVTAERPEGPWSDPVWLDLPGIDPDLAWDEDGSCWCAVAGVQVARIDPLAGRVLEGPWPVWSGTGLQYPEAPHLYRIGGWWYLMIAEGGTAHGHGVSIARARSPRGPYEPAPVNPFLSHRSTDRPIQSTGHADLVEAADGTWWAMLLGTRPRGYHPYFHVLGRETFLTPVTWVDGWPQAGPVEERHPAPAAWHPQEPAPARDDFDAPVLAPGWISPRARPDGSWSLTDRPGRLTLTATGPTLDRPGHTFVGRRQQHPACRISARLDPGAVRAGLSVRMDEAHHYDLEVAGGEASVVARIGPLRQTVASHLVPPGPLTLTVDIRNDGLRPPTVTGPGPTPDEPTGTGAHGPDALAFSVTADGSAPVALATLDGRYLSTEVTGGFTGRVVGMYVTEGSAAFDWYTYEPAPAGTDTAGA